MVVGLKFDLLGWAIGQGLSRALAAATAKDFRRELNLAVDEWAKSLGSEFAVHPQAMFRDPEFSDPDSCPALGALHDILKEKKIPTRHHWTAALLERWGHVAKRGDTQLQPLFLKEKSEVFPLLEDLGDRLYKVCVSQESLFKVSVVEALDELRSQQKESERQFAAPLSADVSVQTLHQQIESTVDCRLDVVAVQGEAATLHIWGGFGRAARDARRRLVQTAILGANFAEQVYVGLAGTTDLRGSDGQGHVGLFRVRFTRDELLDISKRDAIPLGYWDSKSAELPADDNSAFQKWFQVPWREMEEE